MSIARRLGLVGLAIYIVWLAFPENGPDGGSVSPPVARTSTRQLPPPTRPGFMRPPVPESPPPIPPATPDLASLPSVEDKAAIFDHSEPSPDVATPEKRAAIAEIRYVTASNLHLRAGPSTSSSILVSLPSGSRLSVLSSAGPWLEVTSPEGVRGWVYGSYTSGSAPVAPTSKPQQATRSARNAPDIGRIKDEIIQRSIRAYPGNCPCPYNSDSAGRRCGGRSAYSRPGGRDPICFRNDVTDSMLARFR